MTQYTTEYHQPRQKFPESSFSQIIDVIFLPNPMFDAVAAVIKTSTMVKGSNLGTAAYQQSTVYKQPSSRIQQVVTRAGLSRHALASGPVN